MVHASPPTLLLVLTEPDDASRVAVRLDTFLRFSEELTWALEQLVEDHRRQAAPAARLGSVQRCAPDGFPF